MGTQLAEKVYIAIGTDPQEGFATLEWALRKWSSHSISVVILFLHAADHNKSKDYVYTPFGKLPASYVNDEKLDGLRKMKEEENDKLLSRYKAFCGKVKAEVLKFEKCDEPLYKLLVETISRHRITKLVMGITLMKSSSGRSRSAISGSFYVNRHKPEFCEVFIICGGKLVFLREENNEGFIEDEQGIMVGRGKEKGSFRVLLRKMKPSEKNLCLSPAACSMTNRSPDQWGSIMVGRGKEMGKMKPNEKNLCPSPATSSTTNRSADQLENYVEEIESYFHQLASSNSSEEGPEGENIEALWNGSDVQENKNGGDKFEIVRIKMRRADNVIQLKKKEANAHVERNCRAKWAICLCKRRCEELEAHINEEISTRVDLQKEVDMAKEQIHEIGYEVEGMKNKLNWMLELQRELSNKLQLSSLEKLGVEAELEKAVSRRSDMVREIEDLRRQRDVLHRRIEFCKEKDAIGMAANRSVADLGFGYHEFTAEEIRAATDDFSDHLRFKSSAGDSTKVYGGRINNHMTVAIKLYDSENELSREEFRAKVNALGPIRHPHLVAMIGFCSEPQCIVFEYMHNGCSLRDALFYSPRSSSSVSNLNWHARVRIAAQVCSGLAFLHSTQPRPIAHGNLNPSHILLDHNLAAKIHGFRSGGCCQLDVQSDIRAFGNLVLQLLTGRNWVVFVDEAIVMDRAGLIEVLDDWAGQWPMDLAMELAGIAMRCLRSNNDGPPDMVLSMAMVNREIDTVKKKADELGAEGECEAAAVGGVEDVQVSIDVPRVFLCPISQEVMKNPQLAADGFSYELEAMEEWFKTGHDTSPMTNLKLNHKLLIPNHALRSLIHDWHNNNISAHPHLNCM